VDTRDRRVFPEVLFTFYAKQIQKKIILYIKQKKQFISLEKYHPRKEK